MNINKVNEAIKQIGLFLLANLTAILFLGGLGMVVYTFFRISTNTGFFALGTCLIIVSLILARERG